MERTLPMSKLSAYSRLMRIDKPIGSLLLLWPTLWALWLSGMQMPPLNVLLVFVLGVFFMRAAGCVVNDFADRKIDGHVKRTRGRPLPSGAVSSKEAKVLFTVLVLISFALVLTMNRLTIWLSFGGLALAWMYPFMKRHTHLPQVVLGAAFGWSIPMGWAAVSGSVPLNCWLLFLANICWTVAYDTQYAMVDRDDDLKMGSHSTAILFGDLDLVIQGVLYALFLAAMTLVGVRAELGVYYFVSVGVASGLVAYEFWLCRNRERDPCFKAFLHNNWVGAALFVGIALALAVR